MAAALGARYAGVIFAGGPRSISPAAAASVLAGLPPGVGRVGVFGKAGPEAIAAGAEEAVTLHVEACRLRSPAELPAIDRRPDGPNQLGVLSAHVNGTCRIGTDPATSGCTPDGERHGVPGLYVADGSLLPTAPGINPQETIMALASVVAGRIAERHPAGRAGSAGALAGAGARNGAG